MALSTFSQSIKTLDILEKAIVGLEFEFYSRVHFHKLIEMLNVLLNPIKVHGFNQYHHPFVPTSTEFKVEPDLSGGQNMVELVTGPLPYQEAKTIMLRVLSFMEQHAFTTDKCSIHVNISFTPDSGKVLAHLNPLKLIVKVDEKLIYNYFPSREKNIYAKSVKRILPPDGYLSYDDSTLSIVNSLKLPDTKYFGINFSHIHKNRLEWRYIGGKDYHLKKAPIIELFDKFILDTWDSIDTTLSTIEEEKLRDYLLKNRQRFKMIDTYEDFLTNFPGINLQVDRKKEFEILKSYYSQFRDKVYELIVSVNKIDDCLLNWNSTERIIEIVGTKLIGVHDLSNFTFIDCEINEGIFNSCEFVSCEIDNIDSQNCRMWDSTAKKSRFFNTDCNQNTELIGCFYNKGFFDGNMEGGIFRAGKIGNNAYLSTTTKKIVKAKKFFGENPIGNKKPMMGDYKKSIGSEDDHIEFDQLNQANQNPF